jgi:hypothetical protein
MSDADVNKKVFPYIELSKMAETWGRFCSTQPEKAIEEALTAAPISGDAFRTVDRGTLLRIALAAERTANAAERSARASEKILKLFGDALKRVRDLDAPEQT